MAVAVSTGQWIYVAQTFFYVTSPWRPAPCCAVPPRAFTTSARASRQPPPPGRSSPGTRFRVERHEQGCAPRRAGSVRPVQVGVPVEVGVEVF